MPLTQHYYTRDPIENLRIHVTLRKILSNTGEADLSSEPVGHTWDYCFKWQEKKLTSAQQHALQLAHSAKNRNKASKKVKKKTDTDAKAVTNPASPSSSISQSSVLCSYIDADNYVPAEDLARHVTTPSHSQASNENDRSPPTHLVGARQRRPPHETPSRRNTEHAWARHHREEVYRAMHIVVALGPSSSLEQVLCSIQFYADTGLLSVTPGFSTPLDLDNDPDALINGPKLTTYRVSMSGAQYEYTLDNVNDLLPLVATSDQQLLRELQIQDEKQDATRVALLTGSGDLSQQQLYYETMRLSGVLRRRLVLVEVVSALNLVCGASDNAPVFVELHVQFPKLQQQAHWRHRVLVKPDAVATSQAPATQSRLSLIKTEANGSTLTVFNLHTKIDLELCKPSGGREKLDAAEPGADDDLVVAAASPVLSLSIFSQDSWGRKRTEGFADIATPLTVGHHDHLVPITKPILSVREQMEELFLGVDESQSCDQLSSESTTRHTVNSRLGIQAQSTGASIRVRINIVDQSPPLAVAQASSSHPIHKRGVPVLPHTSLSGGMQVVKRSVNEILQSVRLEKRISQASSGDPVTPQSPLSASAAVNSVLARLKPQYE